AAVAAGRFREDLYFRLAVIPIRVPALRERAEDIPALVTHFLGQLEREVGRRAPAFTPAALAALGRHPFPGNVRELRNVVERLVIMNPGARIDAKEVAAVLGPASAVDRIGGGSAADIDPANGGPGALADAVHEFERRHIEAALAAEGGHMTRAAARLGL